MQRVDAISDLITRINNSVLNLAPSLRLPKSDIGQQIMDALCREGYLRYYAIDGSTLIVNFKYYQSSQVPVLQHMTRISSPGCRRYESVRGLREYSSSRNFHTTYLVTTSQGVKSAQEAIQLNLGGELLCKVN